MINRLLSLEVNDFRVFRGMHRIPLDADVIVVYGTNGCGKSSLLYAIEYALTGTVTDLRSFETDFPRCLRHVRGEGAAVASLRFSTPTLPQAMCSSSVSVTGIQTRDGSLLGQEDTRFFVERCYLSQVRLGRLLELYQTYEKGATETPIVTFVKKLLHLEVIDNLAAALHDMGDVRRVRNSFATVAQLDKSHDQMPQRQQELQRTISSAEEAQQTRIKELQGVLRDLGESLRSDEWNLDNAKQIKQRFQEQLQHGGVEQRLLQLESILNELRGIRSVVMSPELRSNEDLKRTADTVLQLETRLLELSRAIEPEIARLFSQIALVSTQHLPATRSTVPNEAWLQTDTALRRTLSDLRMNLSSIDSEQKALTEFQEKIDRLNGELKDVSTAALQLAETMPKWADTLAEFAAHIHGDECPVCLRDYSELRQGSLAEMVNKRVADLGQKAESLRSLTVRRERLQLERDNTQASLAAISARLKDREGREGVQAKISALEQSEIKLTGLKVSVDEWLVVANQVAQGQAEQKSSQFRQQQLQNATAAINRIAQVIHVVDQGTSGTSEFVDRLMVACNDQILAERQKIVAWRKAIDLLVEAIAGFEKRDALDKQWLALDLEAKVISLAKARVEKTIASCRQVRTAVLNAKRKLLESVFDERLNRLWADLFERLARNEMFLPRLSEPTTFRDRIRAAIQAVAADAEPFDNLGAIHSFGTLNTAAVSLFLSLNLVEVPKHKVVLLDDPVQSMDDVHIAQLGLLVRELIDQAGRQVVIAVHEKALFDYLCFELSPSQPDRKLIAIELNRSGDGESSVVHSVVKEWMPDEIQVSRVAS